LTTITQTFIGNSVRSSYDQHMIMPYLGCNMLPLIWSYRNTNK